MAYPLSTWLPTPQNMTSIHIIRIKGVKMKRNYLIWHSLCSHRGLERLFEVSFKLNPVKRQF
jgi:hypothetical protein